MVLSLHASKQAQNHTNCAHCYAGNRAQEFQSERSERWKTHPGCSNIKLKPALNGLLPSELANNQICTCTAHIFVFDIQRRGSWRLWRSVLFAPVRILFSELCDNKQRLCHCSQYAADHNNSKICAIFAKIAFEHHTLLRIAMEIGDGRWRTQWHF